MNSPHLSWARAAPTNRRRLETRLAKSRAEATTAAAGEWATRWEASIKMIQLNARSLSSSLDDGDGVVFVVLTLSLVSEDQVETI